MSIREREVHIHDWHIINMNWLTELSFFKLLNSTPLYHCTCTHSDVKSMRAQRERFR